VKTRAEIVTMVRALNLSDANAVEMVDTMLWERARALTGRPEKEMEHLLAWALNDCAHALRRLDESCADDIRRAENLRSMVKAGARFEEPSEFRGVDHSRTVDRKAVATAAQETLRRVLQAYEAVVDTPGVNERERAAWILLVSALITKGAGDPAMRQRATQLQETAIEELRAVGVDVSTVRAARG
jgi:hypothetical protein